MSPSDEIVEKKLGIAADYQYRALNSGFFLQSNWHHNKLYAISTMISLTSEMEVLDLGPGSGNFEFKNAKKVKRIVAVDYNDQALDFLKNQLVKEGITNVQLVQSDIRKLKSLKDLGKFDLVTMIDVLEHIKIGEARTLVDELTKFLKPGGRVCIITPNYKSTWHILERILDYLHVLPHFEGEQHLAKFDQDNLSKIFSQSGYTTVFSRTFNLFSFLFPLKSWSKLACKVELALPIPIGNLLFSLFEYRDTNTGK